MFKIQESTHFWNLIYFQRSHELMWKKHFVVVDICYWTRDYLRASQVLSVLNYCKTLWSDPRLSIFFQFMSTSTQKIATKIYEISLLAHQNSIHTSYINRIIHINLLTLAARRVVVLLWFSTSYNVMHIMNFFELADHLDFCKVNRQSLVLFNTC